MLKTNRIRLENQLSEGTEIKGEIWQGLILSHCYLTLILIEYL